MDQWMLYIAIGLLCFLLGLLAGLIAFKKKQHLIIKGSITSLILFLIGVIIGALAVSATGLGNMLGGILAGVIGIIFIVLLLLILVIVVGVIYLIYRIYRSWKI